jgi:hypothetical protein
MFLLLKSNSRSCSCHNGNFHCGSSSKSNLFTIIEKIKKLTNKDLKGISVTYGAESVILPDRKISQLLIEDVNKSLMEVEKLEKECKKKAAPDFNNMFK